MWRGCNPRARVGQRVVAGTYSPAIEVGGGSELYIEWRVTVGTAKGVICVGDIEDTGVLKVRADYRSIGGTWCKQSEW